MSEENKNIIEELDDKPIFVIEDKADESEPGVFYRVAEFDSPTFIIEREKESKKNKVTFLYPIFWIGSFLLILVGVAIAISIFQLDAETELDVPISTTEKENIAKLKASTPAVKAEVVFSQDSILGVALNFYKLSGLKAELTFDEPDTSAHNVYLYSFCADFSSFNPKDNYYLGDLVINGEEYPSSTMRYGYCAMVGNQTVIGVDGSDDIKDYVIEQKGSLFRQFVLLSNGVIPRDFHLHGKVERRALARFGDDLIYVETRHKETMWDFADALREYGFIDAIYISGGDYPSFYRDAAGTAHLIGNQARVNERHVVENIAPWIVFKPKN